MNEERKQEVTKKLNAALGPLQKGGIEIQQINNVKMLKRPFLITEVRRRQAHLTWKVSAPLVRSLHGTSGL